MFGLDLGLVQFDENKIWILILQPKSNPVGVESKPIQSEFFDDSLISIWNIQLLKT